MTEAANRIQELEAALAQLMANRDYYKREAYANAERLTELRAQSRAAREAGCC